MSVSPSPSPRSFSPQADFAPDATRASESRAVESQAPVSGPSADVDSSQAVSVPSVPGGAAASCRGAGEGSDMEPVVITWELPQMSVTIRPLEERDVRQLEWQGGEDLRSFYEWQWEQHQAGEREVLVAIFNGFAIGQAAVHWAGKIMHPGVPDIQSLRVMDAFRGLRIGSRLVEACEMDVQRRGCGRIGLSVGVQNTSARRLYERVGYVADGPTYIDRWHYTNVRGERVDVEEEVIDMLKRLPD